LFNRLLQLLRRRQLLLSLWTKAESAVRIDAANTSSRAAADTDADTDTAVRVDFVVEKDEPMGRFGCIDPIGLLRRNAAVLGLFR